MHRRLSLSRLLMEILRWTCSQLQHWLWITGGIMLVLHAFQSKFCRVDEDSDSECGDLEGQLALPGALFWLKLQILFCLKLWSHLLNNQDQPMFRKQELVRAVERRTVLTLSRELSLNLILYLYLYLLRSQTMTFLFFSWIQYFLSHR